MARLEPRIERLESRMTEPGPREIRLLNGGAADYEQQLADAQAAGIDVIVLVPVWPLPQEERQQGGAA